MILHVSQGHGRGLGKGLAAVLQTVVSQQSNFSFYSKAKSSFLVLFCFCLSKVARRMIYFVFEMFKFFVLTKDQNKVLQIKFDHTRLT